MKIYVNNEKERELVSDALRSITRYMHKTHRSCGMDENEESAFDCLAYAEIIVDESIEKELIG